MDVFPFGDEDIQEQGVEMHVEDYDLEDDAKMVELVFRILCSENDTESLVMQIQLYPESSCASFRRRMADGEVGAFHVLEGEIHRSYQNGGIHYEVAEYQRGEEVTEYHRGEAHGSLLVKSPLDHDCKLVPGGMNSNPKKVHEEDNVSLLVIEQVYRSP